jgi:hypothetical protein
MVEDHSWMYSGWDKEGNYTNEWMDKATTLLDHAFLQTLIEVLGGQEYYCHTLV